MKTEIFILRRAKLDEMLKHWVGQDFISHAVIPALYPFW